MGHVRDVRILMAVVLCLSLGLMAAANASDEQRYLEMKNALHAELKSKLPKIDQAKRQAFNDAAKMLARSEGEIKKASRIKDKKQRAQKLKAAKAAQSKAKATMTTHLKGFLAGKFLESDKLDDKLVKYVILHQATPKALAAFAQKGPAQRAMIDRLLSDPGLMKQMLIADGAQGKPAGRNKFGPPEYGPAMQIYTDIQKAAKRGGEGILQRLALAIALEHAVPVKQNNPKAAKNAPENVNPVNRYLHYEKAYLDGELDADFDKLTVWELRHVVNGNEPDETLAWGREMLRNFHPDHIYTNSNGWRYVSIVKSDVKYGSGDVKNDRPELQQYQNILMNGGVCGRRAFFGRFQLRSFGVPTIARPSKGHAALARRTPNGWVVCLGGGWGAGWTKTIYTKDKDFLATTQARKFPEAYQKVKRAYWIGDVFNEPRTYGELEGTPSLFSAIALNTQRGIIKSSSAKALAALGEDLGESNEPTIAEKIKASPVKPEDRKIAYGANGTITIPAAAYSKPKGNTRDVQAMKSFSGGLQIFLPRFFPTGQTILRGGTWKGDPAACTSGTRMLSGGYGAYENWGFRVAMTPKPGQTAKALTLDLGDGVKMEMVYIKPGSFVMGGTSKTDGRFHCVELPKHEVTITKGFYLGKYEVTQAQYVALMDKNPSKSTKAPDCPVDRIGWTDALQFCINLASKTGQMTRLPTEAEWEYASRAGTSTRWFFGDDPSKIGDYAWYKGNAKGKSHPVGQKKPNPWGLYDIYGNVNERIADTYARDYYAKSPKFDPVGPVQNRKSRFEYVVKVPQAGEYLLSANVVTANYDQELIVSADGGKTEEILKLPFTVGNWQDCKPVTLNLKSGENVIQFSRSNPPQYGVAVKSFTLKPATKLAGR